MTLNIKNRLLEHCKAKIRVSALKVSINSHERRPEFHCTFLNDGVGKALMTGVKASSHLKLHQSSLSMVFTNLTL